MLASGHPPDDWDQLLVESRAESGRLRQLAEKAAAEQSKSVGDIGSPSRPAELCHYADHSIMWN